MSTDTSLYYYPSMRKLRIAVLVLLVTASFIGCVSVETSIRIRPNGSGTITFSYDIDGDAYGLGVFDDSDVARPLPVTRDEFREAALVIDGLQLRSHRVRTTESQVLVEARLRFRNPEALAALLGPELVDLELSEERGRFAYRIAPGGSDPESVTSGLLLDLAAYELRFSLEPPSVPATVNAGEVVDGKARFTVSLDQIAAAPAPIVWEVGW